MAGSADDKGIAEADIEDVLDRNVIAHGSNRAQMFVNYALHCAGFQLVYVDHTDEEEIYPADPIGIRADLGLPEIEDDEDDDGEETEGDEEPTDDSDE